MREKIAKEAIGVGKVKVAADRYEIDPALVHGRVKRRRNQEASTSIKSIRQYQKELEEKELENQILRELLKKTTNVLIKE